MLIYSIDNHINFPESCPYINNTSFCSLQHTILCMAQMRCLYLLLAALLLILISLASAATDPAAWPFHFLVPLALPILLPPLLASWLVPGGFAWRKHSGSAPTAPGPVGWPLFGSLPLMADPLVHRKLADLSKAYDASGLMALSLGATPVVISSHPDTAREILHGAAFSDRPAKLTARLLMFERAIGFAPAGDYWRRLRRAASSGMFCPQRISASAVLRQRIAEDMMGRVRKEMEDTGSVRLREVLQRGSLESVMGSVFGRSTVGEAEELMGMVREGYELIGSFNLEEYFPMAMGGLLDVHGVGRRCRDLADRVKDLIGRTVMMERRRRGGRCMHNNDDFLGVLLGLPAEEQQLCDSDMIAVLWEMLFRGTDVVAILMEWVMARMVLHPDTQAKVQRELDAVVGDRPVEDSDVPKLRHLQAVVKEVLRMHPPGPLLSWARLAVRDAVVGGHFVPAGTTAMVNMWAISHDESNWKDPWAFRPERFLEDEEVAVSVLGSDLRLAPFGSGRRVCPGRALGLATVHLWLACLLQRHRWVAGQQPVDLSESLRLSMEMANPLVCRAVPRVMLAR